jgi:hypothetical protein
MTLLLYSSSVMLKVVDEIRMNNDDTENVTIHIISNPIAQL